MNKCKILLLVIAVVGLSGCASFNGQMVDASGKMHNCSTSGGGLGLGMLVGAGLALASNQSCEASMAQKGYILITKVGVSGIKLDEKVVEKAIVSEATEPAAPCISTGDQIVKIDNIDNPDKQRAQNAIFRKSGEVISVSYLRQDLTGNCSVVLR